MATITRARSIQGTGHKRGHKSAASKLNDRTLASAHRKGTRIERYDWETVLLMRQHNLGITQTAMVLERTYFGTQAIYATAGLLSRCFPEVLELMLADTKTLRRKIEHLAKQLKED